MAYDEALASRIRRCLGFRADIAEKRMFGGLAFLLDGRMFCGVVKGDLMVRVGPDRYQEALGRPHVRAMDFTGRPMKGYLFVGPAGSRSEKAVKAWIERGAEFVATLDRVNGTKRSQQLRRNQAPNSRGPLRDLLSGRDRRSVAQSERARALVRADPGRVSELAALAEDTDWLVSMRAMDLLEKLAHEHADWVQPHRALFVGPLADSDKWEIRLQVVRALPLLAWTPRQRERAIEILRRDLHHPQKFVRAWALDGLARFARGDKALRRVVMRHAALFERSGSKALATRARHVRELLSRTGRRGVTPRRRSGLRVTPTGA
jgi:TfoX/Sxy family transcriptional regulator of competence genes